MPENLAPCEPPGMSSHHHLWVGHLRKMYELLDASLPLPEPWGGKGRACPLHSPRALCSALAAAGPRCLVSPWWDGPLPRGAVTSRAMSGAGTVLAAGIGVGAAPCRPHAGGAGMSPAVPGPCFILVSECPSNEPFGSAPMAPAMQPQLSLLFPFPWGRGLSSPGGHWPWPQWAKGSETPSVGATR